MVIGFEVSGFLQNVEHCRRIADGMQHLCVRTLFPEEGTAAGDVVQIEE